MAVFELEKDGKVFEVEADTPRAALAALAKMGQGQKPLGRRVWENVVGDNDPTTQNFGEKVGATLNKAGEAMTFGLIGDEASAAVESLVPGVDYNARRDHYRQQEEVLERDNPALALGAEIGGAVTGAVLPVGAAAKGLSAGQRFVRSTAAGMTGGALYGATDTDDNRVDGLRQGALFGGVGGAVAPMVGAQLQRALARHAESRAIKAGAKGAPTTEQLRAQGKAAYDEVDRAGVQIKGEVFNSAVDEIAQALQQTAFDDLPGPGSLTPNSARVMQIAGEMGGQMAEEPTAALPFRSLDKLRRHAGTAAANIGNKSDSASGAEIIGRLDDFVARLGPDDVVAGDARALQEALPKARDLWQRMSRSQLVDDAIENSGNYLSGEASGLRNQFAKILRNPKLSRGFSDVERAAMRKVVDGSMSKQILDLLGGGLGRLAQVGVGFGVGGAPGAVAGVGLGHLARKGSEKVANKNAEIARALVANGRTAQLPPPSDYSRNISEALLRRIVAGQSQ